MDCFSCKSQTSGAAKGSLQMARSSTMEEPGPKGTALPSRCAAISVLVLHLFTTKKIWQELREAIGESTDQWSFGVVFAQMLSRGNWRPVPDLRASLQTLQVGKPNDSLTTA